MTSGHATVASVASQFLLPETRLSINTILAHDPAPYVVFPSSTTTATPFTTLNPVTASHKIPTIIDIASWADDYRALPEGAFSAPYHYVDAEDSPPHSCGVETQRDCGEGGCVISAM